MILELTRHQSLAVRYLLGELYNRADGRALQARFSKHIAEAHRINLGHKQVALLVEACMKHLQRCDGCMGDEAAGQFLLALTDKAETEPEFDAEAVVEVGGVYRHRMLFTPDLIVRVRATSYSDMDRPAGSAGQVVELDVIAGGYTDRFQNSDMTTRAYKLMPVRA